MLLKPLFKYFLLGFTVMAFLNACATNSTNQNSINIINMETPNEPLTNDTIATAVIGGGCFWCTEAQYLLLPGVIKVESGYAGGNTINPTYEDICTGNTNHAEVVRVTYNPQKLSYDELLSAFWLAHDPTTLNKQGADEGTQYRSIILYQTETEKDKAVQYIQKLNTEKVYANAVVTEVKKLDTFYLAEAYHQNYYNNNKSKSYCMFVIQPKIEKFNKIFNKK
jgi:peptide-methionine (S)-S-oxide reductase